ncbi:MAG: hypothetical protein M9962_09755 [Oligoflexia bacterium]|nr:hypothetical protein [Oligoflexia bacterium]
MGDNFLYLKKDFIKKESTPSFINLEGLAFIVPVYCELYSKNLERLLKSLESQDRMGKKMQVIFLVNNSVEVANDPNSKALIENQETIKWLEDQRNLFSFSIHVIDLSTSGFIKNMGKIRQIGVEWLLLNTENKKNWVVLHLDADTEFIEHSFKEIIHYYETYEALESIFFIRDFELRACPEQQLLNSHQSFRVKRAILEFFNTRTNLFYGVATYQISSRLNVLEKIGGFKSMPADEDTQLTFDLCSNTNWLQLESILVKTEDRTREEGFASKKRNKNLKKEQVFKFFKSLINFWKKENKSNERSEYFLNHSLFHLLAMQLWYKVKNKQLAFLDAVEVLRVSLENLLGKKIQIEATPFSDLDDTDILKLSDDEKVLYEGSSIHLCPVAHYFPKTLLQSTNTPGTDLFKIFEKFMSAYEKDFFQNEIKKFEEKHLILVNERRKRIADENFDITDDPFLMYLSKTLNKKTEIDLLARLYPDWLGAYDETISVRQRDFIQAMTKTAIFASNRFNESSGLNNALAKLTLDNMKEMYKFHNLKKAE